jgi:hypothetical protein
MGGGHGGYPGGQGGSGYHGGGYPSNGYHGGYYHGGYYGGGYYHGGYYGGWGYYGPGLGISIGFPYYGWGYGYPYGAVYPAPVVYPGYATSTYIYNDPAPVTYGNTQGIAIPPPASAQAPGGAPIPVPSYSAPPPARFYCPDAGYYPQVATCTKGWLQVVPSNVPPPVAPQDDSNSNSD